MKDKGGEWTWERWPPTCTTRKGAVPGNKMAFPGIRDDADLADLLAYLRKLSDTPAAPAAVGLSAVDQRGARFDSVH